MHNMLRANHSFLQIDWNRQFQRFHRIRPSILFSKQIRSISLSDCIAPNFPNQLNLPMRLICYDRTYAPIHSTGANESDQTEGNLLKWTGSMWPTRAPCATNTCSIMPPTVYFLDLAFVQLTNTRHDFSVSYWTGSRGESIDWSGGRASDWLGFSYVAVVNSSSPLSLRLAGCCLVPRLAAAAGRRCRLCDCRSPTLSVIVEYCYYSFPK